MCYYNDQRGNIEKDKNSFITPFTVFILSFRLIRLITFASLPLLLLSLCALSALAYAAVRYRDVRLFKLA
jgi:hypothetical protein